MVRVVSVVGARPNFMKVAPINRQMQAHGGFSTVLVHTGQHYDDNMSSDFFRDLALPPPDVNLGVGSGSHAVQTALVMQRIEPVLLDERPDVLLVVGDVNSTVAAALVGAKLGMAVAHVEAGLRSFDRSMPEEVNRIVTDVLSDCLFATNEMAAGNLRREGIPEGKIHVVGDVMVDNLLMNLDRAKQSDIRDRLGLSDEYALLTLHRAANVDDRDVLKEILEAIGELQSDVPIVFPIHPRTRGRLREFGLEALLDRPGITVCDPLGYLDFLGLMASARLILSDSGGIQEEAFVIGLDCITLRDTTERTYTLEAGKNVLVGHDRRKIAAEVRRVLGKRSDEARRPDHKRGGAAAAIVRVLAEAVPQ